MIDDVMLEVGDEMDKVLQVTKGELTTTRTGRVNPSMLNRIVMDYYGALTSLQQLASLTILEAHTVLVSPSDHSAMEGIVTVIREFDLGVNSTDDGIVICTTLPALTEGRHKDYAKFAHSRAEDPRIQVRGIRDRAKKEFETIKRDDEAGGGDVKRTEYKLDGPTKHFVEQISTALSAKEARLFGV